MFCLFSFVIEIDEVLVNMVEKDSEPFTIVEDEGIGEFLQRTPPMFSLQGRCVYGYGKVEDTFYIR